MAKQTDEQIVQDRTTEALARSGEAANAIMKGNADALTESGNTSRAAVQELTKAYQELATKNVRNLTAAMQALAGVKSPTEFIELQQRLIKEGVETTVGDSQRIAQLTTAVFTAAFEPVNATHPGRAERRAPLARFLAVRQPQDEGRATLPLPFELRNKDGVDLGGAMLREIVIEEEMPGDFQTTFRLRVDGNVIAENVTELETQFLVSEMLERIPSLRVAASDDAAQPLER